MSNYNSLIFGTLLAINDVTSFSLVKKSFIENNTNYLVLSFFLYSLQILIFYSGIHKTTMTELNLSWDLISDVLVTIIGIYYFKENINNMKSIAIGFAFLAIVLFQIDNYKNNK